MTRLRYSERPIEWRNLAWSSSIAICLAVGIGAWRGKWGWGYAVAIGVLTAGVILGAWIRPSAFRGWYRAVRWMGHQIGRGMGMVLLVTVFCLVVWPTGVFLRLIGRTPFSGRLGSRDQTYWIESKPPSDLRRLF